MRKPLPFGHSGKKMLDTGNAPVILLVASLSVGGSHMRQTTFKQRTGDGRASKGVRLVLALTLVAAAAKKGYSL
jgi:general stress protein CsbA